MTVNGCDEQYSISKHQSDDTLFDMNKLKFDVL